MIRDAAPSNFRAMDGHVAVGTLIRHRAQFQDSGGGEVGCIIGAFTIIIATAYQAVSVNIRFVVAVVALANGTVDERFGTPRTGRYAATGHLAQDTGLEGREIVR